MKRVRSVEELRKMQVMPGVVDDSGERDVKRARGRRKGAASSLSQPVAGASSSQLQLADDMEIVNNNADSMQLTEALISEISSMTNSVCNQVKSNEVKLTELMNQVSYLVSAVQTIRVFLGICPDTITDTDANEGGGSVVSTVRDIPHSDPTGGLTDMGGTSELPECTAGPSRPVGRENNSNLLPEGAVAVAPGDIDHSSSIISSGFGRVGGGEMTQSRYPHKTAHQTFTDAIGAAVSKENAERALKSKSVIISGIVEDNSRDDISIVRSLFNDELDFAPERILCKRLGEPRSKGPRLLRVTLQRADDVDWLIGVAPRLKQSSNPDVRRFVFINRDRTQSERQQAYENRKRRRETSRRATGSDGTSTSTVRGRTGGGKSGDKDNTAAMYNSGTFEHRSERLIINSSRRGYGAIDELNTWNITRDVQPVPDLSDVVIFPPLTGNTTSAPASALTETAGTTASTSSTAAKPSGVSGTVEGTTAAEPSPHQSDQYRGSASPHCQPAERPFGVSTSRQATSGEGRPV